MVYCLGTTPQMYLTDVEEGGETVFPHVPKLPNQTAENGWSDCALKVRTPLRFELDMPTLLPLRQQPCSLLTLWCCGWGACIAVDSERAHFHKDTAGLGVYLGCVCRGWR